MEVRSYILNYEKHIKGLISKVRRRIYSSAEFSTFSILLFSPYVFITVIKFQFVGILDAEFWAQRVETAVFFHVSIKKKN